MNVFCISVDLICDFKWLIIPRMLCSGHFDLEIILFSPENHTGYNNFSKKKKSWLILYFFWALFFLHLVTLMFPVKNDLPTKIAYKFLVMLCYYQILD